MTFNNTENKEEEKIEIETTENFHYNFHFTEKVNIEALRIIRDNFKSIFEEKLGKELKVFDKETGSYIVSTDYKTALTVVNELYKSKRDSGEGVKYKFTNNVSYGRRFRVNPSLQECPRPVRHTIAKDIYYDIDVKNAHPMFLYQYVKSIDFHHPVLEYYIHNREELLKEIVSRGFAKDREDAKKEILTMLNGGGKKKSSYDVLNTFYDCQQRFLDLFFNDKSNKKYRSRAEYTLKKKLKAKEKEPLVGKPVFVNPKGGALNLYLCEIENIVLYHMENFFESKGVRIGTLCFDGLMVYKEDVKENLKDLLNELEDYIEKKMGYRLEITEKDMDEDIDLTGLTAVNDINITDEGYAKYFLDTIKEDIKYSRRYKTLYKFNESNCLWEEFPTNCLSIFISKICIPYVQKDPDTDIVASEILRLQSTKVQNSIQTQIVKQLTADSSYNDDNFIEENFNAGNGFIPISSNRILDLHTLEVRQRCKTDYFSKTTKMNFIQPENIPLEKEKEVLQYFTDLLSEKTDDGVIPCSDEYRDCLITTIGCIFTGEMNKSAKKFPNFIGRAGNNGKSVFLNFLEEMLGDFIGTASNRVFEKQKNASNHDAEMFSLIGKWLITLSENNKDEFYNEERIKQITGDDYVDIRDCGKGREGVLKIKFRCVPLLISNEACNLSGGCAFKNRLLCFNFNNVFEVNGSFFNKLKEDIDYYFSIICKYAKERFYDKGKTFLVCKEVEKYTREIIIAKDPFERWRSSLNEKYIKGDINNKYHRVPADKIYQHYMDFCQEEEINKPLGRITFYKDFERVSKMKKVKKDYFKDGEETRTLQLYEGFKEVEETQEEVSSDVFFSSINNPYLPPI